ncbi:DUF397 domain-containing protein [Protofrankia symbiont of Coriaria ruscifolia]|uniref:DUF397 domain-containing protein n=1 Tax=Protofrankia symbiont of Coriaria ruscifolia TaxID=1306542 RepID=UPI0010412D3C|nr:DUF397 domain-containing protein [Protofrankia symbiont of Coriaria ruscifolia]
MADLRNLKKLDAEEIVVGELTWITSSYSNGAGGMCVEVAKLDSGVILRDSVQPDGPVLSFSREEWRAFLDGVKDGEFDI